MNEGANQQAQYRAAIERELQNRLARDAAGVLGPLREERPAAAIVEAAARPGPPRVNGTPLAAVALLCLECRGFNDGDARFCSHCGTRFNALVVSPPKPKTAAERETR